MDRIIKHRLATHRVVGEMLGSKGQKKHLHCACPHALPSCQETGEACFYASGAFLFQQIQVRSSQQHDCAQELGCRAVPTEPAHVT